MSVVLRCPNCGTTRATLGECEACHEAEVRYFCTRHAPGLWLDSPTCSSCGAVFGRPTPAAPAATRSPAPPPRAAAPHEVAPRAPVPHEVAPRAAAPARYPSGFPETPRPASRGPSYSEDVELERSGAPRPLAPWQLLLGSVLRARSLARSPAELKPRRGSGCLRRLLVMVVLMVLAVGLVLFLLARSLLGGY